MKTRLIDALWLMLAGCIILLSSCVTQDKCWRKFPPQVKDSTSYAIVYRDTSHIIPGDSSAAQYLVECREENGVLRARIIQQIGSNPGTHLQAPTATITDVPGHGTGILQTTATMPGWVEKWQIKVVDRAVYKTSVYVKVTNELTGWQWAQVWAGRALFVIVAIYIGIRLLRRYTGWKV